MPFARLIATVPTDDPERTLLLFCPEQGGWHTGVFVEGHWLDFATLTLALEPTYWLPEPPEPDEAERQGRNISPKQRLIVVPPEGSGTAAPWLRRDL